MNKCDQEDMVAMKKPFDVTMDISTEGVIAFNSSERTTQESESILWKVNSESVILLLPVIVYISLAVILGLFGNSLVCYIYSIRLRRSPSRFFILFLAILDLMSCVVGACSELTDLFQPFMFNATWSCKLLRFGLSFTIISASFTLICVAFDRYYKVCRPLNAFPVRKVKTLCVCVAVISLTLSSPAIAIFGLKTVQTGYYGINGTECSTADNVRGTPLPIVYYVILFTAFIVLLTCFIFLYIRIGLEIYKRKRLTIGETLPALVRQVRCTNFNTGSIQKEETSGPSGPTDDDSRGYCDNNALSESESYAHNTNNANDANGTLTKNSRPKTFSFTRRRSQMGRMSIRTVRTTSIFFAVSVAFVLSFLPYLIANMLKFSKLAFHDIQNSAEEIAYNFCVRSYFISNFINPVIYSALNKNFRKECKKLFKRVLKRISACCCIKNE